MARKTTAETTPYNAPRAPSQHDEEASASAGTGAGLRASYTPNAAIDEHSYGRDGGKPAILGTVAEVVVGGSSESVAPPAMPGTFRVGVDKNVSTPVSG